LQLRAVSQLASEHESVFAGFEQSSPALLQYDLPKRELVAIVFLGIIFR